jgi:membrane fusion protein (multidrug efflux system)
MATRTTRRMLIMIVSVIVLIALLAFGKFLQIRTLIASQPKPQPQVVTAMTTETQPWQPQLKAVGAISAVRGVDLGNEIAGLVRRVNFKSGQDVKAGDVLLELNAESDRAQLQSLQVAVELATTVLARDRQQFAAQAVSQAQIDADEADLRAKRANLAQQAALVEKKTIRAPFSGRLGIAAMNPGQFLTAGQTIVTLQSLDPVYADFTLPQRQLAAVHLGQRVSVTSDAYPGQTFVGKVTAISPKVDPATRNVQVQATVANPQRQLLPGMFADVNVDAGGPQPTLTLPSTAVAYNPYGSTVFVVESAASAASGAATGAPVGAASAPAKVKQVFVTTGATRGDQVAVIKGLEPGQQVVTSGQIKLKNGTEVVIDNRVKPSNDAQPTPQEK